MKVLVVIPTFNEAQNIASLIKSVFSIDGAKQLEVLVVDDNSPDGTHRIVTNIQSRMFPGRLHLLRRDAKLGLGSAYVAGFIWGFKRDYDVFAEMDADFSHHPSCLSSMFPLLDRYDFIIGSRYVPGGGVTGWGVIRKIISKFGTLYAKTILGTSIHDFTGGFNVWKREVLEAIDPYQIRSNGYVFQIELKYRAAKKGFQFVEFPIVFVNRRKGRSKMTNRIVMEAVYQVWVLKFTKMRKA